MSYSWTERPAAGAPPQSCEEDTIIVSTGIDSIAKDSIPLVSVLICTRNRVEVKATLTSVLANSYCNFELIVIDQSDGDDSEIAIAALDDQRVLYIRSRTRGVSAARNVAIRLARSEICLSVDDDCTVPEDWIATMAAILARDPTIAVAYCNVQPAEYDPALGFIPDYLREGDHLVTTALELCAARGIGAGRAFRKSIVQGLGGFDEMLGPGARYLACEDRDMTMRAVIRGWKIFETARTHVVHYGFRAHGQGRELSHRYWFGIGATYSKPMKLGYFGFAMIPFYEVVKFAIVPVVKELLRMHGPRGITRLTAFVQGFFSGMRTAVDRNTILFVCSDTTSKAARTPRVQTTKLL